VTDTFRSPTIGAVCVLYGMAQVPPILVDLARGGVEVSIIDNSGDLASDGAKHAGVRVATPGLNLGYSKGVNRALAGLTSHPDVVLVVNPDIVGDPEALVAFAGAVAAVDRPLLAAPSGGRGYYGFLPRAPLWLVFVHYLFRTSWHPKPRRVEDQFLSGALLGLNRGALDKLAPTGELLAPELFFMDDVELTDRARSLGCMVSELPLSGNLAHEGGTSMRRRAAVRIYFSRVSKVRYWKRRTPLGGWALRSFFRAETAFGRLLSDRRAGDGSPAHGFSAAARWMARPNPSIDEEVLGNSDRRG